MEVNRTYAAGKTQNTTNEKNKRNSLSIDDFLKIMAAEIQNQNPLVSDGGGGSKTDYISQLAQFTTLEHLTNITENISLLTLMGQQQYSFSLVGKEVTVFDEDGNVTGTVDKVKFQNGVALIQVKGAYYYLGSVIEVGQKEVEE